MQMIPKTIADNRFFEVRGCEEITYCKVNDKIYSASSNGITAVSQPFYSKKQDITILKTEEYDPDNISCHSAELGELMFGIYNGNLYQIFEDETCQQVGESRRISLSALSGVFKLLAEKQWPVLSIGSNGSKGVMSKISSSPVLGGIINDFVRLVNDRVVYDFRTGNIGVKSTQDDSYHTFSVVKSKPKISKVEISAFGLPIPAVAMRTPITDLKAGDVVILKDLSGVDNWAFFLSKTDDSGNIEIEVIKADTGEKTTYAIQDGMLLDGNAVLCVRNFAGNKDGLSSVLPFIMLMDDGLKDNKALMMALLMGGGKMDNNMLLMMMLMEKGDKSKDSLLPLMLMGGLGGATTGGGMSPLMMMMLMGDGDNNSMLPLMLMNGGLGGATGAPMNPLMMMALMGGDNKSLLPLMLMGGLGGGVNPFTPSSPTPAPEA